MKTLNIIFILLFTNFAWAAPIPAFTFQQIQSGMTVQEIASLLKVSEFSATKILTRGIGIKPLKAKGFFNSCSFDKIVFNFTEDERLFRIILKYDTPKNEFEAIGLKNALSHKYPLATVILENHIFVTFEDKDYIAQQIDFYTKSYREQLK